MANQTRNGHPFGLRPDSDSDIQNGLARTYERTNGRRCEIRLHISHLGRRAQEIRDELLPMRHLGSLQPGRCSTHSGATRLSGLEFCTGDSRMRAVGAGLKGKSASKGAGHYVCNQLTNQRGTA